MNFNSKDFKALEREWMDRLAGSGFEDIETPKGQIKDGNRRTVAFDNRDRLRDFFLILDHFLTAYPDMPRHERRVMELHSTGAKLRVIAHETRLTFINVRRIIRRYRGIVLAVERLTHLSTSTDSIEPQRNQAPEACDAARGSKSHSNQAA